MFNMSVCVVALLLAGLVACSNQSGLNVTGGSTSGGQGIAGSGGSTGGEPNNRPERLRESRWHLPVTKPRWVSGWMGPQHRRLFLRIKRDGLLSTAQPFALRNRRGDVC
jgi:hypothetical protein